MGWLNFGPAVAGLARVVPPPRTACNTVVPSPWTALPGLHVMQSGVAEPLWPGWPWLDAMARRRVCECVEAGRWHVAKLVGQLDHWAEGLGLSFPRIAMFLVLPF